MFITHCPICDFKIISNNEMEAHGIYLCPMCGFDFTGNRCSNPTCRRHLHYSTAFCSMCGNESNFYLDCYNVNSYFIDDEEYIKMFGIF